ncbi:hypothetical protein WJX74_009135 [Apatococcus lobatus]|uniref:DUF6891 domain-containing protein n=1 Tax=Apatococcus lobatus TaxID=904363 RepID=A0AAW1SHP4_9CHLO
MAGTDDDEESVRIETPLEVAMEGLQAQGILNLWNAGCCERMARQAAGTRADGTARGAVFFHDGCLRTAGETGVLSLYHETFPVAGRTITVDTTVRSRERLSVAELVVSTVRAHRMGAEWSGEETDPVRVWLDQEDVDWFADFHYGSLLEHREKFDEAKADHYRTTTLGRRFFQGIRRHRQAVRSFRERRAARVIASAMADWWYRPGGKGWAAARDSFAAPCPVLSASGTR